MRRLAIAAISFVLLCALQAMADNMKLECTGTTACTAAGGAFATQQTTSTNPTFNLTYTGTTNLFAGTKKHPVTPSGTAYLAILVPGSSGLTFTVNGFTPDAPVFYTSGRLLTALGESGGNPMNFPPYQSTANATTGSSVSGFEAYDVKLGSFTDGSAPIPVSFTGGAFPNGTIFLGFLEDNNQGSLVVDQTPNSEDLVVDGRTAPTPEPSTLLLTGSSFLAACGFIRRKVA
jgi:hypothetical protein